MNEHNANPEPSENSPDGLDPSAVLAAANESFATIAPLFPEFEFLSLLGEGASGTVFHVRDRALGLHRALKVLHPELVGEADFEARFQREARAMAELRHPFIAEIYGFGERQGIAFIVLEHCPGGTLRAQLSDSNVTPRQHLSILSCVASALEAAHAKAVIHRDLKPENILIDEHGLPRVVDFGLARLRGAGLSELTGHGDVMGTPIYMSPEQHRAEEPGPNSDVYSFGVMCYEAIMGELPLGRFAEPQLAGEDALCGLIARALSVDRGQRPSMQDFVGVLNERRALNSPADESGRAGSRGAATWASQPWRAIWAGGAALSLPPQWSYLLFIVTVAAAILRFIETRIPHWRLPPWPFLLVAAFGTIASAPLLFLLLGGFSRQAVWWVAILTPLFYLIWLLAEIHAVLPANEKESRAQQKTERVKSGRRAAARASSRRHSRRSRRRDTSQRVERHPGPTTRS